MHPAFSLRGDAFMGSRFLPFDLHYYTFPAARDQAAQEPNIRSLNRDYVCLAPAPADPVNDAVTELICAFYPTPASNQNENAAVPNWNANAGDRSFYINVLAGACRTCHVSPPFGNPTLRDQTEFRNNISNIQTRVCDQRVMPHAKHTHDLFWTSVNPNQAGLLQLDGQGIPGRNPAAVNAQCGLTPLISGGNISSSFYQAKIQPIFDNPANGPCSSCHAVAGGSGGLSLNFSNSYANLVGIASSALPSMLRITSGNHNNSYLWHKIIGSHVTVAGGTNGSGRMPPGGASLTTRDTDGNGTNDLLEIQNWIDGRALKTRFPSRAFSWLAVSRLIVEVAAHQSLWHVRAGHIAVIARGVMALKMRGGKVTGMCSTV